ncbi:LLM class flavin-dependent oxidoreductase [Microlunatus sp. GCM10028923]|uniref:LLM class flavin-dependent oxidoreductase n=1 Tax=Microlunatus sp. GCM10028923 TaxID=3273400 RepID=UPI003615B789
MQYGLGLGPVGPWGDPRTIAELAGLAESSGWDGVFVEDYVFFHDRTSDTYDPWVTRAAMLDESLAALGLLWSGEPVTYWGEHVHLDGVMLRPRPVQRPRIPIVVGGSFERRGPRRRALRWDGCCLYGVTADNRSRDLTPEDVRTLRAGAGDRDFMIIIGGRERRPDLEVETRYVTSLADAGADWWLEYIETTRTLEHAREVIRSGPVRATT